MCYGICAWSTRENDWVTVFCGSKKEAYSLLEIWKENVFFKKIVIIKAMEDSIWQRGIK